MTPLLPGPALLAALRQELADTADTFDSLAEILPQVNEPSLRDRTGRILATGRTVFRAHAESPGPDIATLLDSLVRGLLTLDIPTRDPDIGITKTLVELQKATGWAVARLTQAQKAAAALGWMATNPALPPHLGTSVTRDEAPHSLARIADGLELIAHRLDRIEAASAAGNAAPSVQQRGLVNVYLGEMRVQLDIARMQLTVGDRTIDFAALWRAGAAMADLTADFVATVSILAARFVPALRTAVERTRRSLSTVVGYVAATARRIVAGRLDAARHPVEASPEPPPGFSHDEVRRRLFASEPVPHTWRNFIINLNLSIELPFQSDKNGNPSEAKAHLARTQQNFLSSMREITQFTNLTHLDVSGNPISSLTPILALKKIESIVASNTFVETSSQYSGLENLRLADFENTRIRDLFFLRNCFKLESLNVAGTNVFSILPLMGLKSLRMLTMSRTSIRDLVPLSSMHSLESLSISMTPVYDLRPLSNLRRLNYIDLRRTYVTDLSPLVFCPNLKTININGLHAGIESTLPPLPSLKIIR